MLYILREVRELQVSTWELVRILVLTVVFALFEGVGIGLLIPVLRYIEEGFKTWDGEGAALLFKVRDALGVPEGAATIVFLLSVAFLALLIRSVAQYLRDVDAARLKLRTGRRLRVNGVNAFFQAGLPFLKSLSSGRIYSTLTVEVDRAAEALASRIVFVTVLLLCFSYTLLLFLLSPALTLLSIPVFGIIALAFRLQSNFTSRHGTEVSGTHHLLSKMLADQLDGMIRIKMRAQEERAIENTSGTIMTLYRNLVSIEKTRVLVDIGVFPLLVLMSFIVLSVAVLYLDMALASLSVFMFVLVRLAPQVSLLNGLWTHIHSCMESYRELRRATREALAHVEKTAGKLQFLSLSTSIEFESVCFYYSDSSDDFQLDEISFSIPKGSLTALVGRSGSGKTTLVRLLTRFYTPTGGRILIDHEPIENFALSRFRRSMALVSQEPYLFDSTIRENLLFGISDPPSEDELWRLLELTHCADFISQMQEGLDSPVGSGGNRLSQGQRQRILIAHALISRPEILILDEPTSALDSESEKAIQSSVTGRRGELTTLVIAHRLATIRHADQIVVLDEGRVISCAPHEDLLRECDVYRVLFENQLIA